MASELKYRSKKDAHYESVIRVLEEEKDFYKQEYEKVKLGERSRSRSNSPVKGNVTSAASNYKLTVYEEEIVKLKKERGELQGMLDRFERHMREIQASVKLLTNERDKTQQLYEQANEELLRLRGELAKGSKASRQTVAAQSILRRVEAERDEAINDLRRANNERDTLREKLKVAANAHLTDKAYLEQAIEDLRHELDPVSNERDDLLQRVAESRSMIHDLEHQVSAWAEKMKVADSDIEDYQYQVNQLRTLLEQTEKNLSDTTDTLTKRSVESNNFQEKCNDQDRQIQTLIMSMNKEKDFNDKLRGQNDTLLAEKEQLKDEIEVRLNKIRNLNAEIESKSRHIGGLERTLEETEVTLKRVSEEKAGRERDNKAQERQLEARAYEVQELRNERDLQNEEIKKLQSDLSEITHESQNYAKQLQATEEERDNYRQRLYSSQEENSRQHDTNNQLEGEKGKLLEHLRKQEGETARWEGEAQALTAELQSLRLDLINRDAQIRREEENSADISRELQQTRDLSEQQQAMLAQKNSQIGALEDKLRLTNGDKEAVLSDLAAVREICVKLDSAKDTLSRTLAKKNLENDQLGNTVEDHKQEIELLRRQIESEKSTIRNLEDLLTANKESEFGLGLAVQEKESEIQLFKERLALSESKCSSQQREIQSMRTRVGTSEAELERSRKQLTNERFEKERAEAEVKRLRQNANARYASPSRKSREQ